MLRNLFRNGSLMCFGDSWATMLEILKAKGFPTSYEEPFVYKRFGDFNKKNHVLY